MCSVYRNGKKLVTLNDIGAALRYIGLKAYAKEVFEAGYSIKYTKGL